MERTQAALEKARRQRQRLSSQQADEVASAVRPAPAMAPMPSHPCQQISLSPRHLRNHRIVAGEINGDAADIFRMLRTQVLRRLESRGSRTLAICSAGDGEGKTVVGINLAISLALEPNHTVLLVDLDFRRPSIHQYFGFSPEVGLDDVLAGRAVIDEALVNPGYERLLVLPTRGVVPLSSEVLMSEKMAALARDLRDGAADRLVVYDLPPVLQVDDCLAFLRHLDACLFVIEEGASRASEVLRALNLIEADKIIGTVLNKASGRNKEYYDYSS